MLIKVAQIEQISMIDGPGIRTVIFFPGCSHNCKGCHNKELQNFENNGIWMTNQDIIDELKKSIDWIDGITLSGGDPLYQIKELKELLKDIKADESLKKMNILLYTGYNFEEIPKALTQYIDIIIDGKYMESLPSVKWAGSGNQRYFEKYGNTNRFVCRKWDEFK